MAQKYDKFTYRVTWSEDDSEFVGLCAEFPSLSWLAQTPETSGGTRAINLPLKFLAASGSGTGSPLLSMSATTSLTSLRIPFNAVHRQLAIQAAEAGVSLNRLASAKLSHQTEPQTALDRLLDPANVPVNPSTLERAALALGKSLKVELA